ncbi:hypothetical protein BGZ94_006617 [Podila epigama]|nr:hypothetical protein BGZ94_006617 [Podila epigama]
MALASAVDTLRLMDSRCNIYKSNTGNYKGKGGNNSNNRNSSNNLNHNNHFHNNNNISDNNKGFSSNGNGDNQYYYKHKGAMFPCYGNGDDSPIDRTNFVSFPERTIDTSYHRRINLDDSGYAPSIQMLSDSASTASSSSSSDWPSLSCPTSPPETKAQEPSSETVVSPKTMPPMSFDEQLSSLRHSIMLDELLGTFSSDTEDDDDAMGVSTKRRPSMSSLDSYQECKRISTLSISPIVSLNERGLKQDLPVRYSQRTTNAAKTNVAMRTTTIQLPVNTGPLNPVPRHQTKARALCISSIARALCISSIAIRPEPPIRRVSFRMTREHAQAQPSKEVPSEGQQYVPPNPSKALPHQARSLYQQDHAVTRSDSQLDLQPGQKARRSPRALPPRVRPSVFGAFSQLAYSAFSSSSCSVSTSSNQPLAPCFYPSVASSPSPRRGPEPMYPRKHITDSDSDSIQYGFNPYLKLSNFSDNCADTCASTCNSKEHNMEFGASTPEPSLPLFAWTPTPEPRASSITGNHMYSSSSPCLATFSTSAMSTTPTMATVATTTTIPAKDMASSASSLQQPPRTMVGRRFSFQWLSKNNNDKQTKQQKSFLGVAKRHTAPISPVHSAMLHSSDCGAHNGECCTGGGCSGISSLGEYRYHKNLPGLPSQQDHIVSPFLTQSDKNGLGKESKRVSKRSSILSATTLRSLIVSKSNNEHLSKVSGSLSSSSSSTSSSAAGSTTSSSLPLLSAPSSWASKLKLKRGGPKVMEDTTPEQPHSVLGATRARRGHTLYASNGQMRTGTASTPSIGLSGPQKKSVPPLLPSRRLIPRVVQRVIEQHTGQGSRPRSNSAPLGYHRHTSSGPSVPSSSSSTTLTMSGRGQDQSRQNVTATGMATTATVAAVSAMPKYGLLRYNAGASASSPCLQVHPTTAASTTTTMTRTAVSTSTSSRRRSCSLGEMDKMLMTKLPMMGPGIVGHQQYSYGQEQQLGQQHTPQTMTTATTTTTKMTRRNGIDRCILSKDPTLQPKQVVSLCEKEKFRAHRHQNQSYISFHFDISHLEDEGLPQPAVQPQQQEQQPQQQQQLSEESDNGQRKAEKELPVDNDGWAQNSTTITNPELDKEYAFLPSSSSVSSTSTSSSLSLSSLSSPTRPLLPVFRRPGFLSSMPSLSLSSLSLTDLPSSILGRSKTPRATEQELGPSSRRVSGGRWKNRSSTNMVLGASVVNHSSHQLHRFCHEGLQQPEPLDKHDDRDDNAPLQRMSPIFVNVFSSSYSPSSSPPSFPCPTEQSWTRQAQQTISPSLDKSSVLPLPAVAPLRQFQRARYQGNRFSVSSISLPTKSFTPSESTSSNIPRTTQMSTTQCMSTCSTWEAGRDEQQSNAYHHGRGVKPKSWWVSLWPGKDKQPWLK